ncbi:hypothetical protein A3L08_01600 [Thermococcus pacificus]|uniref:Tyr recombinase domain-containing protein n=2 Tax=Thermococcus pacificus TaxID=71998 RepID=A0A218P5Q8_9EURY|nr:hypothetical protein A3L08_01600 [Thermococcus pacificus]
MTVITRQDVQALLSTICRIQFAKREEVSKRIANKITLGLLIMATSGLRVYELTKLPLSYIDKGSLECPPRFRKQASQE